MFCLTVLIFSSCEKVIPVNLNDSTPQIVIEGEIDQNKGPYLVFVSSSVNFQASNSTIKGRDDAQVSITDLTANITEILFSQGAGVYQCYSLQGVPGRSYFLKVILDGKTYTSTSTIPLTEVKIDNLYAKKFDLDKGDVYMVPVFKDPVGKGNYYRLRQWVRGIQVKGSYVRSDDAADGLTYDGQLYYSTAKADGNPLIEEGDLITAELQCVDKASYDYFRTLSNTINQDASTPSNPLSNLTGGALGVFNACISTTVSTTAKF